MWKGWAGGGEVRGGSLYSVGERREHRRCCQTGRPWPPALTWLHQQSWAGGAVCQPRGTVTFKRSQHERETCYKRNGGLLKISKYYYGNWEKNPCNSEIHTFKCKSKTLTWYIFLAKVWSWINDGSFSMLLRTILEAENKRKSRHDTTVIMQSLKFVEPHDVKTLIAALNEKKPMKKRD